MKKIFLKIFILCFFIALQVQLVAQEKVINGKVSNKDGDPIANVSVLVKGTKVGTVTDGSGNFSLNVSVKSRTLVVTSVGYQPQEVSIIGSDLQIVLESVNSDLGEVLVVGYGSQKVTKVSGAIATVKSADIEKLKPVRMEDALQGRASGVTVISAGSPGVKPTVLIRGIPSYTGTDPVVVVDGSIQTLDDLNSINPSDIETINVLKDAATTAIYGVKGGNGV
ncbi:MAG: TonB-dependent receptor plug domain-containing protein, partial [Bacteroidota bacterium]